MNKLLCIFLCAFVALFAPAAASTEDAPDARAVPVIMYHSVCKTNNNDYVLHPDKLRRDLEFLKQNNYTPVFLREVADFAIGKGNLPEKPIVLSFDDGFYNNYAVVMPLIQEFGFKFTVCLVGKFVEKEANETVRSKVYSYLNYSEIQKMTESGVAEFANHTFDWHKQSGKRVGMRKMRGESDADYKAALTADSEKCRELIRTKCRLNLNVFAYPFGYYNNQTLKTLRELGYRAILTCEQGINRIRRGEPDTLLRLKRFNRPNRFDTEYFFRKIVKI